MKVLDRFRAWLDGLTEAGRRHSAADEQMLQAIHDHAVSLGAMCGTAESARAVREALELREIGMSHGDIASALRTALRAKYPGERTYVFLRDVYDDSVVYEVEDTSGSKLYRASYAILDGKVELGEPVEVVPVTQYVPVGEAERDGAANLAEVIRKQGDERVLYSHDGKRVLGRFRTRAEAVRRERQIALFKHQKEAARESAEPSELTGDLVPLVEKAVRKDGTIPIKVIQPGWGSSGYYPAEVLERDGPKVFTAGTKMYWDHPTATEEAERPERSLRDLAAELVTDARWDPNGPAGPGLYADAKVFGTYQEAVEELAPHIGVSIRALGNAKMGEAEGRKGRIIEGIVDAKSVDFVTTPGAGGQILQLFEAARGRQQPPQSQEGDDVSQQANQQAQPNQALEEARQQLDEQGKELARLREALMLRDARDIVTATLAGIAMPEPTRARLAETLAANPPIKDGALDREALVARVQEAAKAELEYLARATGSGRIVGMGSGGTSTPSADEVTKTLESSFARLGLSESAAKLAAAGRR